MFLSFILFVVVVNSIKLDESFSLFQGHKRGVVGVGRLEKWLRIKKLSFFRLRFDDVDFDSSKIETTTTTTRKD